MTTPKFRTVVLGNFDGVHRGHQQLIGLGRQIADQHGEELAVFTFYPQIQQVVDPTFCYLLSESQKQESFRKLRVDVIETVPFEAAIAHLTPEEFVRTILVERLRARHVAVGFNFSFGYKGVGNSQMLQELASPYGIQVTVMEPCYVEGEVVSSTAVREYLRSGQVEKAHRLLGYPYRLEGLVIHGNQIGRTIGFPTANMQLQECVLRPANGVYAAKTYVDGKAYYGILNIGLRPTIENSTGVNMEVHLFDFDADIYGKTICTELYYFLRKETRFASLDALKAQLQKDKEQTRRLFALPEVSGNNLN